MKLYILLALSGFLNDAILTSYYVNADRGRAVLCVVLCGGQQALAIFQAYHSFSDCAPGSPEQIRRWCAVALGYCAAAWVTVSWLGS